MKRISYLGARILYRCRKDKSKIYPGKFVYATSSNKFNISRGTLLSVKSLMKLYNWRGDFTGFVEAPYIEEVRDLIRKTLKIDIYYYPEYQMSTQKLIYRYGIIDLIHKIEDLSEDFYDTPEEALEKGCMKIIREYKQTFDITQTDFKG
jgi:hypothetical protein